MYQVPLSMALVTANTAVIMWFYNMCCSLTRHFD